MVKKIGIRELIEFTLKSGDLTPTTTSTNTALLGARIHRKLQKQAGPDYQKEINLKYQTKLDGEDYQIEGRADGVVINPDTHAVMVDEIKTSDPAFAELTQDALTRYWGQAKFYAWLLAEQQDVNEVTVQLTYFQTTTEIITRKQEVWQRAALKTFVDQVLQELEFWLHLRSSWCAERNQAAADLTFPYPNFRDNQHQFAGVVYKTIAAQKILLAEAPTGTGKTIATLFPAVKALANGLGQRIFYLTAKNSTRQVAEKTIAALNAHGAKLKAVTITAKDKICFQTAANCPPGNCPYTDGYYDRNKDALKDLFAHEDIWDRATIERYAKKHTICPFEFSLDASLLADVVIGDYNYLFDPQVYLQRFFADPQPGNIFLIDEAHNLVSRGRDMYSSQLNEAILKPILKDIRGHRSTAVQKLRHALKPLQQAFKSLDELFDADSAPVVLAEPDEDFLEALYQSLDLLTKWLQDFQQSEFLETVLDVFFALNTFLKIYDFYGTNYQTIVVQQPTRQLTLQCLDPSEYLQDSLHKGDASILFSATLTPLSYYQETLTAEDPDSLVYRIQSPFPLTHQLLIGTNYIQTTYHQRAENLPKIVAALGSLTQGKKGNYLVFLPSYGFLDQVATAFQTTFPKIKTTTQISGATEAERREFLAQFETDPDETLVGFAVLGGAYSEGIDLQGTRLIGVAIVSVGLPGLSLENNLLKDYYQAKNHQGYAYAYQLPGFNNVLQASGRVIRGEQDRGVILLIDQRFASSRYRQLFPPHWQNFRQADSNTSLDRMIDSFWEEQDEDQIKT
ncbi:helicase C-terminal domain-containing protein [Lapidilactobacillus wuchangensis]|uniref:helicase C-terminal domain-containing protein n=1 Tax=Lapidilactobacillus wuchangensis TaxID=2486001 RepID=UPI000F778FA6|nr:helicase C-terminal domain-containing protein [Lapidilactobacillus wuchangensis]